MTREKDWIDVMRSELRDAELPLPSDGWERLRQDLAASPTEGADKAAPVGMIADRPVKRSYWPRMVAAAAAVLVCVVAGEMLWHANDELGDDGSVLMMAAGGDDVSAEIRPNSSPAAAGEEMEITTLAETARVVENIRIAEKDGQSVPERLRNEEESLSAPVDKPLLAANQTPPRTVHRTDGTSSASSDLQPQAPLSEPAARQAAHDAADGRTRAAVDEARRSQALVADARVSDARAVAGLSRRKTSVGLFATGGLSGGNMEGNALRYGMMDVANGALPTGNAYEIGLLKEIDYDKCSFRHHQPVGFGLSVRREFRHGLSLESGLVYTLLRSDVRTAFASEDISQQLHMLGVPLRVNWNFLNRNHFLLYIGAGGMVEKCLYAKFGSKVVTESGVQWSAFGVAGAEYRFGRTVGLYFEPELSYYFTRTGLETARTESPLTLTFRLGMRFSF